MRVKVKQGKAGSDLIEGKTYTVSRETGLYYYLEGITGGWSKARFTAVDEATVMILPADPEVRKGMPITTGVLDYFPLALAEVARVSKAGNDQHNPGQPLHWDKTKSLDHADCIPRHLIDRGARDTDGQRHSAKLAWRALALLQTELENEAKQ